MSERASDAVQQVREQAASIAQQVIEQASSRVASGADRAKSAASSAKGRVPDMQQKVNDDVVPNLREIALQAASAALDLWTAARERAEDVVVSAEHALSEPASNAVHGAERRARQAADVVVGRASDVSSQARDASRHVAERAGDASTVAKDATKHAADSTVTAGKDTGATLLWTAAAAGLVFYALLDKERREQVLHAVDAVVHQAREVIRDVQGYDEEFV